MANSAADHNAHALRDIRAASTDSRIRLWFVLLCVLLVCQAQVDQPLVDAFHEGEYLSLVPTWERYRAGLGAFPLLIHGAMDYLPAVTSQRMYGVARFISGTRALNALLTGLACFLFLDIARLLVRRAGADIRWVAICCALLIAAGLNFTDVRALESGMVSLRDVAMLSVLWTLIVADSSEGFGRTSFLALAAIAAGIGVYWCYDRGLVGIAFIGVATVAALRRRAHGEALLVAGLTLVVILIVGSTGVVGAFADNARNIQYWMINGRSWSYRWDARHLFEAAPYCAAAVLLVSASLRATLRRYDRHDRYVLALLILATVCTGKIALNRADPEHLAWGVWPLALMLTQLCAWSDQGRSAPALPRLPQEARMAAVVLLVAMAIAVPALRNVPRFIHYGLLRPVADTLMLSSSSREMARSYVAHNPSCYYGLVGDGAVPIVTHLPYCSRIFYPVYANAGGQREIISDLGGQVSAVLVESDAPPIDAPFLQGGVQLRSFVQSRFRDSVRVGSYLIRYR